MFSLCVCLSLSLLNEMSTQQLKALAFPRHKCFPVVKGPVADFLRMQMFKEGWCGVFFEKKNSDFWSGIKRQKGLKSFFHPFPWLQEYETSLKPKLCYEEKGLRKRPEN